MTEATNYCFECKRPLVEIDNRGQRLTGCMTCNIFDAKHLDDGWTAKGSVEKLAAVQMDQTRSESPAEATRAFIKRGAAATG